MCLFFFLAICRFCSVACSIQFSVSLFLALGSLTFDSVQVLRCACIVAKTVEMCVYLYTLEDIVVDLV